MADMDIPAATKYLEDWKQQTTEGPVNVFCNRDSCRFQLNEQCRTSAISIDKGACSTYEPVGDSNSKSASAVSWDHLLAAPREDDRQGSGEAPASD